MGCTVLVHALGTTVTCGVWVGASVGFYDPLRLPIGKVYKREVSSTYININITINTITTSLLLPYNSLLRPPSHSLLTNLNAP